MFVESIKNISPPILNFYRNRFVDFFFHFSLDCIKWGLMPNPNEETRRKCALIKGRFTGDPSHEYEHSEKSSEEEQGEEEGNVVSPNQLFDCWFYKQNVLLPVVFIKQEKFM